VVPRYIHIYTLILLFLAGCGTFDNPKDYQPATSSFDSGQVCLYRTAPRSTPGVWQEWILDGKWSGEIKPGSYYCKATHAGRHIVRVGIGDNKVEFMLEKDQQVFVRFDVDRALIGKGIYPVLVDRKTAHEEFKLMGVDLERMR
jgi:hypothetical protein